MTYVAPIKDMQFLLDNLVGLDDFSAMPEFTETSSDLAWTLLTEGSRYFNDQLAPTNWDANLEGSKLENGVVRVPEILSQAWEGLRETGWVGASVPQENGGMGLPWALGACGLEMMNSANLSFSLMPLLTQGAIDALLTHGTREQIDIYVEKMATGEWSGTMNLTEPHAGSDVGALRSKAIPQDDGSFLVTGQKIYITWGDHELVDNIIHLVLAREPDSPEGTKGISLFLVPKFLVKPDGSLGERNDVRVGGVEEKIGIHASPTCVMRYGDDGGARAWRIGEKNGGMAAMFTMMNNARLSVGMQGVAVGERAYQQALAYAKDRVQGVALGSESKESVRIIEHPDVRRNLMTMASQVQAGRGMALLAYASLDKANFLADESERGYHKRRVDLLTPLVKGWCTDMGVEVASIGIQIHGGMGFIEETGAGQHYRDARILPIYEGTNGIQALDLLGRKLARDQGQAAMELLGEMRKHVEQTSGSADTSDLASRLSIALDDLEVATRWTLKTLGKDLFQAAAGATPLLNLWGTVVGGWVMLQRAAAMNVDRMSQSDVKAQKLVADYYIKNILPRAKAFASQISDGGDALLKMDEEQF